MAKSGAYRWRGWRVERDKSAASGKPKRPAKGKKSKGTAAKSWWLVFAKPGARCEKCDGTMATGELLFYRYDPRGVLCKGCGNESGIAARAKPSRAVRQARKQKA